MPSPLTTILLDLDGTLVDPAEGIVASCRHALDSLGCSADPADDLRWLIGPPVRESFARLVGSRADPEEAVRRYRARYSETGLTQATVYGDIPEALDDLRRAGFRLLVCTSKARVFAERVVAHFDLSAKVDGVYGPELDGRWDDKGDLIGHILDVEGLKPGEICMVGDRKHDILAAARHGAPGIGVLWGYGGEAELRLAGARRLIDRPCELPAACAACFAPAFGA
jgi:phosphoglycolate phosphatase